jgi:hypothetical protein
VVNFFSTTVLQLRYRAAGSLDRDAFWDMKEEGIAYKKPEQICTNSYAT